MLLFRYSADLLKIKFAFIFFDFKFIYKINLCTKYNTMISLARSHKKNKQTNETPWKINNKLCCCSYWWTIILFFFFFSNFYMHWFCICNRHHHCFHLSTFFFFISLMDCVNAIWFLAFFFLFVLFIFKWLIVIELFYFFVSFFFLLLFCFHFSVRQYVFSTKRVILAINAVRQYCQIFRKHTTTHKLIKKK